MIKPTRRVTSLLVVAMLVLTMTTQVFADTYRTNQSLTMYCNATQPAHDGTICQTGTAAVHASGGQPVIPFGTYLIVDSVKDNNGKNYPNGVPTMYGNSFSVLQVHDTGTGPGMTTYWVDFYVGTGYDQTEKNAYKKFCTDFGIGTISYHYF